MPETLTAHGIWESHRVVPNAAGDPPERESCTQATVHRVWIADEGYYDRQAAESLAENITTIRREMATLGRPWLNILKMVPSGPYAFCSLGHTTQA